MRGERESKQGTEDRTAGRPPQRPPVHGELLPALPARRGVESFGTVASERWSARYRHRPSWACQRNCRPKRSTNPIAGGFSIVVASVIRSVEVSPAPGGCRLIKVAAEVIVRASSHCAAVRGAGRTSTISSRSAKPSIRLLHGPHPGKPPHLNCHGESQTPGRQVGEGEGARFRSPSLDQTSVCRCDYPHPHTYE